jgi:hypothetical protein
MNSLTLNPSLAATPVVDRPLAVPALAALNLPRRNEQRPRRRFSSVRALHINDGGFRPFRVY